MMDNGLLVQMLLSALLGLSVMSVAFPTWSPWTTPWIQQWLTHAGWIGSP
jgi:hypothetical protein